MVLYSFETSLTIPGCRYLDFRPASESNSSKYLDGVNGLIGGRLINHEGDGRLVEIAGGQEF